MVRHRLIGRVTSPAIASLALAALAATGLALARQDDKPSKPEGNNPDVVRTSSTLGIRPSIPSQAQVPFPGFRAVPIHLHDESDHTRAGFYVHRPILALFDQPGERPGGLPPIVKQAVTRPDGSVWVVLEVLSSDKKFRELAADVTRRDDLPHILQQNLRPDQVTVVAWPLTRAIVDVKLHGRILTTGDSGPLNGMLDTFDVEMDFTATDYAKFLDGIRRGDVTFHFAYTYENRELAIGRVTAEATKVLSTVIDQAIHQNIDAAQAEGKAPITLSQVHAIDRQVRSEFRKTIRATRPEILPLISNDITLADRYFELMKDEIPIDQVQKDDALWGRITRALEALIKSETRSAEDAKKSINDHEVTKTDRTKLDVNAKVDLGVFSLGGGAENESTTVDRDQARTEIGLSSKFDKTTQTYVPSSIAVYRLAKIDQKTESRFDQVAYLGVGTNNNFLAEKAVPCTFLASTIGHATTGNEAERFYDGVPIGVPLQYFAKGDPPKGYLLIHPSNNWPEAPWVPDHLRGKPMPDMDGFLMGGTNDLAMIGTPWTEGKVPFPGYTINDQILGLTEVREHLGEPYAQNDLFAFRWWAGGLPPMGFGVVDPAGDPAWGQVARTFKNNADACDGGGRHHDNKGFMEPVRLYGAVAKSTALSGTKTLAPLSLAVNTPETNPRHIRCRYIIRVR